MSKLTEAAGDMYEGIVAAAWAEYQRIAAPDHDEDQRIMDPAWAEYQRILTAAGDAYRCITAQDRAQTQ